MSEKRMNLKSWLAAACVAAVGAAVIPMAPAQAGMGTGNPPPPPPPPVKKSFRLYEGSTDSALTGKGFQGVRVNHSYSLVTGRDATTTSANGVFEYVVRSDQRNVVHQAQMFGLIAGWGSADLIVATDAMLKIVVGDNEPDFDELAGSGGLVTSWKMDFEYVRGPQADSAPQQYAATPSLNGRSFGTRRIPRHYAATPFQVRSNVTKAVFQLKKLEGFDAGGTMRLKWMDKLENGRKAVFPGYNSDGGPDAPLVLHKILATTEK